MNVDAKILNLNKQNKVLKESPYQKNTVIPPNSRFTS